MQGQAVGSGAVEDAVQEDDERQVQSCKEDIDSLLTFAGLYSAALTALSVSICCRKTPLARLYRFFVRPHYKPQTIDSFLAAHLTPPLPSLRRPQTHLNHHAPHPASILQKDGGGAKSPHDKGIGDSAQNRPEKTGGEQIHLPEAIDESTGTQTSDGGEPQVIALPTVAENPAEANKARVANNASDHLATVSLFNDALGHSLADHPSAERVYGEGSDLNTADDGEITSDIRASSLRNLADESTKPTKSRRRLQKPWTRRTIWTREWTTKIGSCIAIPTVDHVGRSRDDGERDSAERHIMRRANGKG